MTAPDAPRAPRRTVTLPPEKVTRFRLKCRENGHIGSTLIFSWLWTAEARAAAGHPLPQAGSQQPRGRGERGSMLWSQTEHEYQRCVAAFAAAGSSVRDVIGELVDLYLKTGGDLPRMSQLVLEQGQSGPAGAGGQHDAGGSRRRSGDAEGLPGVGLLAAS